jgi:hypothetical protein
MSEAKTQACAGQVQSNSRGHIVKPSLFFYQLETVYACLGSRFQFNDLGHVAG